MSRGYDGEVISAYVSLGAAPRQLDSAGVADDFRAITDDALCRIQDALARLISSGAAIAIWGGTGKSAAFINRHGRNAERFPTVVDSDADKVGTFVPGVGQEIRSTAWLKSNPADTVIIPPQWRARDIILEMEREGIGFERILMEYEGALIDYFADAHRYRQYKDGGAHPEAMAPEALEFIQ